MATPRSDLIKQIKRYQNNIVSIDPPEKDEARVLHYIKKLAKLPVKYEDLEETGAGKTINRLRNREGSIGEEATLLVAKWKSKIQKEVDAEEQKTRREENEKDSRSNSSGKQKFSSDDGQRRSKSAARMEEYEPKCEPKSDAKSTHLITLKSRHKRKHSEQREDEKESKCAKMQGKESGLSEVKKNNGVDVSLDKVKSSHADEVVMEVEESKNERSHEDRKHKKSHHEKRHKSSKRSHDDESDRHRRHRSKSSHQEKKVVVEENVESSQKNHRSKDSKAASKSENRKEDRKHEPRKRSASTTKSKMNEKKSKTANGVRTDDLVDSIAGDGFGAALLNIPHTMSPKFKKRSTSSKASTYQDSLPSPSSSQKSLTNFDMFSTAQLGTLNFVDDLKDDDFYQSPTSYSQTKSTPRTVSEEEMLNSMIVTKNQKTKVYSGNKLSNANVPTLFELCSRVLQDNFDALEYTGGVPYNILKPILEKVSAQQLYTFENFNPYLIGETDALWKFHANREFRNAQLLEYESWRDLYLRCFEEREAKLQTVTKNITQTIANSTPVRKTQLAYLDAAVKPPRNVARSQAKNGTGSTNLSSSSKRSPPNATQSLKERLAKDVMGPNAIQAPSKLTQVKKKKAPLMQKSLQLMNRLKR